MSESIDPPVDNWAEALRHGFSGEKFMSSKWIITVRSDLVPRLILHLDAEPMLVSFSSPIFVGREVEEVCVPDCVVEAKDSHD